MRFLAGGLLLAVVGCANPAGPGRVATGSWAGPHIALQVTADAGRVEYDCAHGQFDEPLVLDRAGRFDVRGTHTPEHGGPVRDDERVESRPARYVGRVEHGRMTLVVTLEDTGEVVGTFTLVQGVEGRLTKCL